MLSLSTPLALHGPPRLPRATTLRVAKATAISGVAVRTSGARPPACDHSDLHLMRGTNAFLTEPYPNATRYILMMRAQRGGLLCRCAATPQAVPVQRELSQAAAQGKLPQVRQLLQDGADAQETDDKGWTPMHHVADVGSVRHSFYKSMCTQLIKELLQAGADIDAIDNKGWTALHHASSRGYDSIVAALLSLSANAAAETPNGVTALHVAAQIGHEATAATLLKNGAPLAFDETSGCKGWSPLHCAADTHQPSMLKLLLDSCTTKDINATNHEGWSPLHVAASEKQHVWRWMVNNQEKMQSLQDAKHEILTISKPEGWTPLFCAISARQDGHTAGGHSKLGVQDNAASSQPNNTQDSTGHFAAFNGVNVQVLKGDLTQQQVAAIVNPTNSQLSLTGGTSDAIAKAFGRTYKKKCSSLLASLPDGQSSLSESNSAIMPTSSALACEYVIHAITPTGSDKQALVDTVHSVLTTTAAAGLESVALPLIGSGNAGWAVQLAAEAHIEALLQFVNAKNTASSLKETNFVDIDDEAITALNEQVELQHQSGAPVTTSKPLQHTSNIQVIKGDLTKQQATAIVHPTNKYLSLGGGTSSHIAQAVGPAFEKDCKALMSSMSVTDKANLQGNCVIMPCSGSLPFQNIIHAAGPPYSGGHNEDAYASTVRSVLTAADENGMQSLAMPLIGQGGAGWPASVAAKITIEQIIKFFNDNHANMLKEVRFVDLDDDAITALSQEFGSQQASLTTHNTDSTNMVQRTPSASDGVPKQPCQPCNAFQTHMHHIQFLDSGSWLENLDKSLSDKCFLHGPSLQQPSLELSLMEMLSQHDTNINAGDELGCTALHWAAASNRKAAVIMLLFHGVDVNTKDTTIQCHIQLLLEGCTALHYAVSANAEGVAKLLTAAGADSSDIHCKGVPPALLHSQQQLSVALTDLATHGQGQVHHAQKAIKELRTQSLFEPAMSSTWPKEQQDTIQSIDSLRQEVLKHLVDSSNDLHALVEKVQKCQQDLADLPNSQA